MLNLNSIMIGSENPKELAEVYKKVFDKEPDMIEDTWSTWQVGSCSFSIGAHSEISGKAKEPQRMILNLETNEVQEEFERISKIEGIEVIKEPYDAGQGMYIATFADPDGNYFQLMPPWEG